MFPFENTILTIHKRGRWTHRHRRTASIALNVARLMWLMMMMMMMMMLFKTSTAFSHTSPNVLKQYASRHGSRLQVRKLTSEHTRSDRLSVLCCQPLLIQTSSVQWFPLFSLNLSMVALPYPKLSLDIVGLHFTYACSSQL